MANILQALFGMGPMGRMGPRYPGQIPGIGGGYPGTPPFNPNAPMPTMPVTPSATPGPASAPPAMGGPQWLQKFAGGVNRIAGGLAGGQGAPPQVMQAMLGTLLANSGPAPKNSRGLLQPFGEAMLAGGQARQQFDENEMRRQALQTQAQGLGQGTANIQDYREAVKSGYTKSFTEYLKEFQGREAARPAEVLEDEYYRALPSDEARAEFLARKRAGQLATIGQVPTLLPPGVGAGVADPQSLSSLDAEAAAANRIAGATQSGKEEATTEAIPNQVGARTSSERLASQINDGYRAADSLPVINRGLELIDRVSTGGLAAVQLAATNMFGVTGADESELSANLGKAVLAQLRETFGAAFTEAEGARLADIEAGFGKSTEGNKRLLQQTKTLIERAARRGIAAARRTGADFDAEEIERAMNIRLSPPEEAPAGGTGASGTEDPLGIR